MEPSEKKLEYSRWATYPFSNSVSRSGCTLLGRNPSENDFYLFLLVFLTKNFKTSTEKDFPKHLPKKNHLSLGRNSLTRRSGPPGVKASTGGPAGEEPCLSGRKMSLQPSVEAIDGRPDVDNASTKRRRMSDDERLVRSRERNRHHAKMTRLRKKQKMEFLQVIFSTAADFILLHFAE